MDDAQRIELLKIALFCAQELDAVIKELYPDNEEINGFTELCAVIKDNLKDMDADPNDTGIESKIHPPPTPAP